MIDASIITAAWLFFIAPPFAISPLRRIRERFPSSWSSKGVFHEVPPIQSLAVKVRSDPSPRAAPGGDRSGPAPIYAGGVRLCGLRSGGDRCRRLCRDGFGFPRLDD